MPRLRRRLLRLRCQVEDNRADVDSADAVDHRMVGLRDDRGAVTLQAFDEVDLPQRPVAVEWAADETADQLAQLIVGARSRQRGPAYVVADVEVDIVGPHWVAEVCRHPLDHLPI